MIPFSAWDGTNPDYNRLWRVNSARNRLRKLLLDHLLYSLPDDTVDTLVQHILNSNHRAELRFLGVERIIDPLIDLVLDELAKRKIQIMLDGQKVDVILLTSFLDLEDSTETKLKWLPKR